MNRFAALWPFACLLCLSVSPTWAAESLEAGVTELAVTIVEESQAENRHSIAVAPFPHADGSLSVLSNYLVDELVLALFAIPDNNMQIVERSQLEMIFSEMDLSSTGRIDVSTAVELGRLHGVDALVIGSITTLGDSIRVIARMIETDTGRVFSSAATTIPKTETTSELMAQKIELQTNSVITQSNGASTSGSASAGTPGEFDYVNEFIGLKVRSFTNPGKIRLSMNVTNVSGSPVGVSIWDEGTVFIDAEGEIGTMWPRGGIVDCRTLERCEDWDTLAPGGMLVAALGSNTHRLPGKIADVTFGIFVRADDQLHEFKVFLPGLKADASDD